jgi:serine/threonine protein kinase
MQARGNADSATKLTTPPAVVTAQGTVLGTFQYMSPEQIEGLEADSRSDVFALGCVLYEMLSGRFAFEGKSRTAVTAAIALILSCRIAFSSVSSGSLALGRCTPRATMNCTFRFNYLAEIRHRTETRLSTSSTGPGPSN